MKEAKEIISLDDIKKLVDTFYGKVRKDELIGPVFNERIQDRWPQHLAKMYTFWQTVLLGEHTYFGSPFPPHATLPVSHQHFEKWLERFKQPLDRLFTCPVAYVAQWRAGQMEEMLEHEIEG